MKRNDSRNDSWASLASELGIDDPNASVKVDSESIFAEPEILPEMPFNSQEDQSTTVAIIVEGAAKTSLRTENLRSESDFFGKGLLEDQPETLPTNSLVTSEETPVPPKTREGKKNFFDRFPKINLFGTSTKESLAAVVENVKAPSLSGKSFTSSKLEKVPVSQERVARREKDKSAELEDATPNTVSDTVSVNAVETAPITSEQKKAVVDLLDPWSKIASQVGSLSTTSQQQPDSKPVEAKKSSWERPLDNGQESNDDAKSHRRSRAQKALPSMFDEQAPESEEAVALKSLIGADHGNTDEAERRLRSLFEEEIKSTIEPKPFVPDQEPKYPPRRRGEPDRNRFKDRQLERENTRENIKEKAFTTNSDDDFDDEVKGRNVDRHEHSSSRERGRRGSRYEQREESRFPKTNEGSNHFEIGETTWDIEDESKPVERSSRGRRRRERSEQPFTETERRPVPAVEKDIFETEASSEDFDFAQLHKNIPSWDDAINLLIENNIVRHSQGSGSRNNKGRR